MEILPLQKSLGRPEAISFVPMTDPVSAWSLQKSLTAISSPGNISDEWMALSCPVVIGDYCVGYHHNRGNCGNSYDVVLD